MSKSVELLEKTLQVFRLKKELEMSRAKSNALKEEAENLMMLGIAIPASEIDSHKLLINRLGEIRNEMRELSELADKRAEETKELGHSVELGKLLRNICNN